MTELGLEEALDIAMEAELKAQAFYAQAAVEVQDRRGRDLLGRLAAFEQYHYQKLAELATSLRKDGHFIDYDLQTMASFAPLVVAGEATATVLEGLEEQAAILTKAIENEKTAEASYQVLAQRTTDAAGRAMFQNLATEERLHQRILEDEFFSLSNKGSWAWSGLYGE
jgi:rubrerythrin